MTTLLILRLAYHHFIALGYNLPSLKSFRRIFPQPRSCGTFRNKLLFINGLELLAPRRAAKLEEHPLLASRNFLFL